MSSHRMYKLELISGVNSNWAELSFNFQLQPASQNGSKIKIEICKYRNPREVCLGAVKCHAQILLQPVIVSVLNLASAARGCGSSDLTRNSKFAGVTLRETKPKGYPILTRCGSFTLTQCQGPR